MREETAERLKKAENLVANGTSVDSALARLKLGKATWYNYRRDKRSEGAKVSFVSPLPKKRSKKLEGQQMAVVFGSPSEIAKMIHEMRQ